MMTRKTQEMCDDAYTLADNFVTAHKLTRSLSLHDYRDLVLLISEIISVVYENTKHDQALVAQGENNPHVSAADRAYCDKYRKGIAIGIIKDTS